VRYNFFKISFCSLSEKAEAIKIVEGVYSMGFDGFKKIYGDE